MPIIELADTSHHHAEIPSPNLDHSADPEKAAASGRIRINGVALTLFADINANGVFDSGDTQIATTTTAGGGAYSFTGLAPGDYIVQVDAANFTGGGALAGFKNASPIAAADPNGNVDNNNDGQPLSGGVVLTKAITLSYNNEPTAGTGNDTNNTLDIGLIQNQPPTLDLDSVAGGTGFTTTFTEDGSAQALASANVLIGDPDDTLLKSATITITNFVAGQDVLAFTANANTGDIAVGSNSGGVLTLTSSAGGTFAQWQAALRATTYADSSQDPNGADRLINVVVDDGQAANHASTAAVATVHVTPVNDPPTLSATATNPTYTEDAAGVAPFSSVSASTVEAGQTITQLVLTVSNVSDVGSEILNIGGTDVALTTGNSVGLAGGVNSTVGVSGGTATVTLSKSSPGIPSATVTNLGNAMTYRDTSQNPTAGNRVVTLTSITDDGGTSPGVATTSLSIASTVNVVPVNDPPVLTAGGSSSYVEQAAAVVVDNTITVSDVDSPNLVSASATYPGTFQDGDTLHFTDQNGITGSFSGNALSLTGSASPAAYQAAMRSVTFDNLTNDDPTAGGSDTSRIVGWQVSDGSATTPLSLGQITITPVNDAPALDLDADNSTATGADFQTLYIPAGPAVAVADSDVSIVDPDNATLASATLTITNVKPGDLLGLSGSPGDIGNIAASGFNTGTGVLTLTSSAASATLAQWQTALHAVQFSNSNPSPDATTRNLTVVVNDGAADSNIAHAVIALDQPPVITANNAVAYTEQQPSPVVLDAGLTLTDADTATLDHVTVQIGNFVSGDVLAADPGATGIAVSYDNAGTLTLSGVHTTADYLSVLRTVSFATPSDNPTAGGAAPTRTVTWVANDGTVNSAPTTTTVNVAAVNDPPAVDLNGAAGGTAVTLSYTENQAATAIAPAAAVTDVDSATFNGGSLTVSGSGLAEDQLTIGNQGNGVGQIGVSGSNVFFGGTLIGTFSGGANGTSLVVAPLTAGLAAVQALARDILYSNNSNAPSTSARSLSFTVVDGDGTTNGGADTGSAAATINLTAVNDPPNLQPDTTSAVSYTENAAPTALFSGESINVPLADPDASANFAGGSVTVAVTAGFVAGDQIALLGASPFHIAGSSLEDSGNNVIGTIAGNTSQSVTVSALTAAATPGVVNQLIASFGYQSSSDNPGAGDRTVTETFSDGGNTGSGGALSDSVAQTVHVTPVNDAPALDLDADNSSGRTGADFTAFYRAQGPAVAIADSDISIIDPDNATLASATVTLTNKQANDLLAVNGALPGNIVASAYNPATGVLSLASAGATATLAQWQSALHQIVFSNSGANPSVTARDITVTVNDGAADSNIAHATVTLDQPPTLVAGNAAGYTQGGAPAALDPGLSLSDPDSATLAGASVRIAAGFVTGDTLGFTGQNGIAGSYNAATGVLTLSGAASVGAYQAALASVTYASTSGSPTDFGASPSRTLSWTANDGTLDSAAATSTLAITAVTPTNPLTPAFDSVRTGDFNGDGSPDLVFRNSGTGATEVLAHQGLLVAGQGIPTPFDSTWTLVGTGDFNGDGKTDLVYFNAGLHLPEVQFMNGTAPAGGGILSLNPFGSDFQIAGVGDVNGDGKADLVWHRAGDGFTAVQLLNGTTSAGGGVIANNAFQSPDWQVVAVGDFNNDGNADLVYHNTDLGLTEIQLLNGLTPIGGGVIAPVFSFPEWQVAGVGDFNGDGSTDLVFRDTITNVTEIQFLHGLDPAGGGLVDAPGFASAEWDVAGAGDFNRDGHTDLVFHDHVTGATEFLFLNGITPLGGGAVTLQ